MTMKYFFCLLVMTLMLSCKGQEVANVEIVPYGKNPVTPPQHVLIEKSKQKFDDLEVKTEPLKGARTLRTFFLDGKPFEGWAYQVFTDTEHRFRYTLFEKGLAVWQIGYFNNGNPGHDFHMKNGYNKGSQRMWHKEGGLYIDTFFLEGEVQDGPQYRWFKNGQLASDALYQEGELIYEVLFDIGGTIKEKKGKVPSKYN